MRKLRHRRVTQLSHRGVRTESILVQNLLQGEAKLR